MISDRVAAAVAATLFLCGLSGAAGAQTATNLKCDGCVGRKDIGYHVVVGSRHLKHKSVTPSELHDTAKPAGANGFRSPYEYAMGVDTIESIEHTSIVAPGKGVVTVFATWAFHVGALADQASCNLATVKGAEAPYLSTVSGTGSEFFVPGAAVRTFNVKPGETEFWLNCSQTAQWVNIWQPSISAIFTPQKYKP